MNNLNDLNVAVLGLGYVGLPLALEFSKIRRVLGFDIDERRINELKNGVDSTNEISVKDLQKSKNLVLSSDSADLKSCNCFIATVPTPVDRYNHPDLAAIKDVTGVIAANLKEGDIVIYESTVFPGATEEVCVPLLEQGSGLKFNEEFFCGYSPERINPGDKSRAISTIKKITSGSTPETAVLIDQLYRQVITAGTQRVSEIKVAEAAKVIENTQRDLNIALINELSVLFDKLEIDTEEVLVAAESKWNFISFRPGLVGGHCIGVDPYYLLHKANEIGYHPELISAGRRVNDSMPHFVVSKLIKTFIDRNISIPGANILILGFSFKENCPDFRNTKIIDIIEELNAYKCKVDVFDPWVDAKNVESRFGIEVKQSIEKVGSAYDAILLAVGHEIFKNIGSKKLRSLGKKEHILYDLKYLFPKNESDIRL